MTHDPYGDADLVTLYDGDNPGGRDQAFTVLSPMTSAPQQSSTWAAVPVCSHDPLLRWNARWSA